jgi:hypothetical protein
MRMTAGETPTRVDGQHSARRRRILRRLLTIYLVVYYAVIAGAVLTVWRSGLIAHLDWTWTLLVITLSIAFGVLLASLSRG